MNRRLNRSPLPRGLLLSAEGLGSPFLSELSDVERPVGTPEGRQILVTSLFSHISPASATADRKRKFAVYERSGVEEYWIVEGKVVEVYSLKGIDHSSVEALILGKRKGGPPAIIPRIDIAPAIRQSHSADEPLGFV